MTSELASVLSLSVCAFQSGHQWMTELSDSLSWIELFPASLMALRTTVEPDIVIQSCNPSTGEAEAGELQIQDLPGLCKRHQ